MPLVPDSPYIAPTTVNGPGGFVNLFSFTAPTGAVDVSGTAFSIDVSSAGWNINDIQISLFDASDVLIETGDVGEQSMVDNAPVTEGKDYYFKVTGNVPQGFSQGSYVFNATRSRLPRP